MAEPITIKKKKLTVKSKRVKAAAAAEADAAAANEPAIPVAAMPMATTKQPSYTLSAILAILTFVIFLVLIGLQYTEYSFLNSAFPRLMQAGY